MMLYSTNIEPIHPQHIETYVKEIHTLLNSEKSIHPYYGLVKNVHEGIRDLIKSGKIDEHAEGIKEFHNVMKVVKAKKKKELSYSAFKDGRRKHEFQPVPWVTHHPQAFASCIS